MVKSTRQTFQTPLNDGGGVNLEGVNDFPLREACIGSSPGPVRLGAIFILRIELQRGARRVGGAMLNYILMLAVMSVLHYWDLFILRYRSDPAASI